MSSVNFSLPMFCERKENVKFSPDVPFQQPTGTNAQKKDNIVYNVTDRSGIYDWAKGYFQVAFNLTTTADLAATGTASILNGSTSLISRLSVFGQDGRLVYESNFANQSAHWKKVLEYSPDYAESVAENEFFYLDSEKTVANDTNLGHKARRTLLDGKSIVRCKIPLSSYAYFKSLDFNNVFLTGQQVRIVIDIEQDSQLVFRTGTDPHRVVISQMDLILPQLTLRPSAYDQYISSIDSPIKWNYLRERVHQSSLINTNNVRFKITGVNNPKKLLFWFLDATKINDQGGNPYLSQPFTNIGGVALNSCRVEFSNGAYYPRNDYIIGTELTDIARVYDDLMAYSHNVENKHSGSLIKRTNFNTHFSCVFIDLEYQQQQLVSDSRDFTFVASLSGTPTDVYCYCMILHEEQSSFGRVNGNYMITSEPSS